VSWQPPSRRAIAVATTSTLPSPLISAPALAELLACTAPPPALLDVRWQLATGADRDAYLAGHIPGAAFIDLDAELSDPAGPRGRHPLPTPDRFAEAMRAAGVSGDRATVVYDAAASMAAARAWWLLRYFGHRAVTVLDGGLGAWTTAGLAVQSGVAEIAPGDFVARPGQMPTLSAVEAGALAVRGVLIDGRAEERFLGLHEPVDPVAGHIPGARNLPATQLLDDSGRLRDRVALRAAFASAGVHAGMAVGAYCGSGVTAALEVLALEQAGYEASLYPGSWSEWITDPKRPIAGGREPGPRRSPSAR
jgi:thiosulfate/3-mercaptopyruvate sulfurtransferase